MTKLHIYICIHSYVPMGSYKVRLADNREKKLWKLWKPLKAITDICFSHTLFNFFFFFSFSCNMRSMQLHDVVCCENFFKDFFLHFLRFSYSTRVFSSSWLFFLFFFSLQHIEFSSSINILSTRGRKKKKNKCQILLAKRKKLALVEYGLFCRAEDAGGFHTLVAVFFFLLTSFFSKICRFLFLVFWAMCCALFALLVNWVTHVCC